MQLPFETQQSKIVTKLEEKTDSNFGKSPSQRTIQELIDYGIVCIDKPQGPTSHQVSAYTRDILGVKKTGHSGSLDPNVTGVLVTATGRATRIVDSLLKAGKEYICVMHLHQSIEPKSIKKALKKFEGKIRQLPPLKSAVKRQLRYRKVYYNKILEISEDNKDVLFRTGVQAGTYIRKLVHDIGIELGCGAHMAELRRTKVAYFNEDTNMVTLQDLKDSLEIYKQTQNEKIIRDKILPIEVAVEHMPKIWVRDSAVNTLCHGANLNLPGISKMHENIEPDMNVALMTLKDELIATGMAKLSTSIMLKKDKGLAVKINKVYMLPDTYPKLR